MNPNASILKHVFLAEDDEDDRLLFNEALLVVAGSALLTESKNGLELMKNLHTTSSQFPDIIFLDLNMPLKDGFECLEEIRKERNELANVPVVVFTTSSNKANIDVAYKLGASGYAVKPDNFEKLKNVIIQALKKDWQPGKLQPSRQDFVLTV